uniref:Uncharacterized protein n=1 Tax=Tetranychus urticae TaxID=32264 RepID=T1JTY6_TETUR
MDKSDKSSEIKSTDDDKNNCCNSTVIITSVDEPTANSNQPIEFITESPSSSLTTTSSTTKPITSTASINSSSDKPSQLLARRETVNEVNRRSNEFTLKSKATTISVDGLCYTIGYNVGILQDSLTIINN